MWLNLQHSKLHFPHILYLVLRNKIPLNLNTTNLLVFGAAIQCVSCEGEKESCNILYIN